MRFSSIQSLRALAALGVLLYHESSTKFTVGTAGVDVFFVISGFIMGTIGCRETPLDFMRKRIIRIVPLYWVVTAGKCLVSLIPGVFQQFSFDLPRLLQSLFFIPYFNQAGAVEPLLVPGWTLNYEMFFYAVFAVGLAVRRPVAFSAAIMLVLVVAGWITLPENPILQTWTNPLLLEFIAGLILSQDAFIRGIRLELGLVLLLFGAACFALLGFLGGITGPHILIFGVPAFAMVAGAVVIERAGRWPHLRLAEAIGDSSYSLYLLHGYVIAVVDKVAKSYIFIQVPAVVVGSVILAFASYRIIERPVARILRGKLTPRVSLPQTIP